MSAQRAEGRFLSSLRGLKQTRCLVSCALLLAMEIALNLAVSIPIGPTIRVSFGYLCVAATGLLFGPLPAIACGALGDIIGHVIKPMGAYFPGFTLSAMIGGFVYAWFFYERPVTLTRAALSKLIIDVAVNLLLNTFWLKILYGKGFWAILPGRAIKNLAQYPVDVLLLYIWLRWLNGQRSRLRF